MYPRNKNIVQLQKNCQCESQNPEINGGKKIMILPHAGRASNKFKSIYE